MQRILRSKKGTPNLEKKRRQWAQIEFAGRTGFSASRHSKLLEKRLAPLAPKIATLVLADQIGEASKTMTPVAAKLATTFALMALKVRDRAKRQRLYTWAVQTAEKNCNEETWKLNEAEKDELKNICGSPESAKEFLSNFASSYEQITKKIAEIFEQEIRRRGLRRG